MDKRVPVNHIIPFSAVDGEGNRTAIFLQGCNLDCKYCHNPETRSLCVHCGKCVEHCPEGALTKENGKVVFHPEKCVSCDTCIHVCEYGASPKVKWMTVKEVVNVIRKQMPFIRGITVSGGECTLYPEFLEELFKECHKFGLTSLIDTNGMVDFEMLSSLLDVTDGVMLDIKAFHQNDHINVTGFSNETVLKNATYLAKCGKLYEIRTVVVKELFEAKEVINKIANHLSPYIDISKLRYKLIAYRPFGVRKQYQCYESPDASYMRELQEAAIQAGFQNIIII